jgi:hypothetical protein
MSVSMVRADLVATLEEIYELQGRLVKAARNSRVPVAELVAQVSALERLDDRRDDLLSDLRREASKDLRDARPGRPVREVVLDALAEFRWPQNAGFLEEYLLRRYQLQIDSRAFAPLRRDERRAWDRARGPRRPYVAPALKEDGSAHARWLTSSAWTLDRRIVTDRTPELLDLQKILTLAGRSGTDSDLVRPRRPTDQLLEQYAEQLLEVEPPPLSADPDQALAWRLKVRAIASDRISEIRRDDEPARQRAAERLSTRPERDRTWGRDPSS